MKNKLLFIIFIILPVFVYSQSTYTSNYGYSIEIPGNFTKRDAIGKNVDLSISDNLGNAFVIVVKKIIQKFLLTIFPKLLV